MTLRPYYRTFTLPWEGDPEERERLRKFLGTGFLLLLVFTLIIPFLHVPKPTAQEAFEPRLARVMIEQKPPPPPPPLPPPPKIEPKIEPTRPVRVQPKPVDQTQKAREKAQKQLNQIKDELADLRELAPQPTEPTKNLSGAVGADSHAERSLITSKVGVGSGGITSANSSRGFGTGAGSLAGVSTTAVSSSIAGAGARGPSRSGASGKASRSREEIELVFDRNKGAIYALYSRALRDLPELQGKVVLEFTIAPSGAVTMCRVVSSELHDPELEQKIVARVRMFRFEPRDVEAITTTKPIDFFPA
ncbi:MAG: AgmX/PglI C-terminal domain-containing protein [Steroidobacteraceae bacterium]